MKGLLALNRILILYRELCKVNSLDLTYNEFIVMVAIHSGHTFPGSLHRITLIDRGQLTRLLSSLVEKKLLVKEKESRYSFTPLGCEYIKTMYRDRDEMVNSIYTPEEVDRASVLRDSVIQMEKRLSEKVLGPRK